LISFKEEFKKSFFSIPIQIKIKEKWQARQYREENGSLEAFFSEQLRLAQYFEPKMLNFEINFKIAQQLSWRAREALVGADFEDAQTIITRLQYLDLNPVKKNVEINNKKSNNQSIQIRNLAVRDNKHNDKENNKPYIQNRNRNTDYNQQRGYYERGYYRENKQNWKNKYRPGNPQNRNYYNRNNAGHRYNTQYPYNNYTGRFDCNNSNKYNSYYNYRDENQREQIDNSQVQQTSTNGVQSGVSERPWKMPRENSMPLAYPSDVNTFENNYTNTNVSRDSQPSTSHQNTIHGQHLN